MNRFSTLCLLTIWSVSLAAEPASPLVETDEQRLEFSKTMRDVQGPEFGRYAGNRGWMAAHSGGRKNGLASFGWYSYLAPRAYDDTRNLDDSQVFDRVPVPGISFNWSGSAVSLYRNGLSYEADNAPWFINVNFRNVNRGSKLMIRDEPVGAKGKALVLEFGVSF